MRLLLGLGLSALCLWLVLRHLDWPRLRLVLADLDWRWLWLGAGFLALGYGCRILRWHLMLRNAREGLAVRDCIVPLLASIAANNLLPLRMGDLLRCAGFSRWLGIGAGAVTATVILERLLDLLTILLALGLALLIFAPGQSLLGIGGAGLLALGLVAVALLLRPLLLRPPLRGLVALAARVSPAAAGALSAFTTPLLAALLDLGQRRRIAALLGWSAAVWGFEGALYWAVAMALPALPFPEAGWLAMPAGTVATLLPSTPGHFGPFDYAALQAMTALGNPASASAAFVLLAHALLYLTTTLAGGLCLLIWRLRGAKMRGLA